MRLLLIEDDEFTRDLYKDVFTKAGFEGETAADGEEGVVKAREGSYKLILLDVMMPKLDGLGVLKALKASPAKSANGPILLLTNLAHDPVVTEAIQNGAKDSLVKADYNPDELVTKVKSYL